MNLISKGLLTGFVFALTHTSLSAQDQGDTYTEQAIAAFEQFFEAFHRRDTTALKAFGGAATLMQSVGIGSDGVGTVRTSAYENFVASIGSIPDSLDFEERILSVETRRDGPLVHIWAPYEFYIDGKLSHSGANSLHLIREGGRWRIAHIIDTRKR